ncbi:MAG: hypothetical protein H0T83_04305 [Chthoniobacterales bacterium]|nr:hypothetical protein [Chthoniobacterales bacterium]
MTAALLQGVPVTTLDADLWINLPERRYVRVLDICQKLGATILAKTVVALSDDTLVNLLYRIDGLENFAVESDRALELDWLGLKVAVVPLESIKSKRSIGRPKDIAYLPLLEQTLKAQARLMGRKPAS